jgi:6-phosphogluconate dehydrogenase
MAAYAEGLNVLRHADAGRLDRSTDAETAPLRHAGDYQYQFDLNAIAEVWRRGSVISSWLLDLTAAALFVDADLQADTGQVSDSGEGRWTSIAAIESGAPAPVLTTALYARFSSRGESDLANRVISAMRHGFGGHPEK